MDQAPALGLKVITILVQCLTLRNCMSPVCNSGQTIFSPSVMLDVGSWREGGGRNLNSAPSPPEMENRAVEESNAGLGTSTPPGEADETVRNSMSDGQRVKIDARDRVPLSGPSQPKLNGGQQPPAGVPTHFDPAFKSMMPSYVSYRVTLSTF